MNENNSSNPSWFNLDLKLDRFNKRTFNRITKKITFPRDTLTSSIDNWSTWHNTTHLAQLTLTGIPSYYLGIGDKNIGRFILRE